MAQTADVIVIGAGVIGAAVAYELAKQGRKVLSLDANGVAGHGSTAGSCAIVRVHYSTLEGCAMAFEGFHDWDGLARLSGRARGGDAGGVPADRVPGDEDRRQRPSDQAHGDERCAGLPLRGVERRADHRTPADLPHGPVRARQAHGRPGLRRADRRRAGGRRLLAHGGLRDRPRAVGAEHRRGGGTGGRGRSATMPR
jgi:glycine/D-amino acid oxidase-like deaminating enzyme